MTFLFFASSLNKNLIKYRSETSPRYNLVTTKLMILVVLISIKGCQCDGSGEATHVSTYKSTIRILPSSEDSSKVVINDGKEKENQHSSSLPSKFTHPVILSPYR